MENKNTVSQNIKALRLARKLSLKAVADGTGLAKSTLQSIEQGKLPTLTTLYLLAKFYDVPIQAFFEDNYADHPDLLFGYLGGYNWFFSMSEEKQLEFLGLVKRQIEETYRFVSNLPQ